MGNKHILQSLSAIQVGVEFVYLTAEMVGPHYRGRTPPFEGQILTVVGFKACYVNSVLVQDPSGMISLLPLADVERALRSQRKAHNNGEVIHGKVRNDEKGLRCSTRGEVQKQHPFITKSELGCQASRSNRNYVPCGKAVTHVLEFTDEERRKRLLICKNHAGEVDERTILDSWRDVSVTPL